MAIRPDWTVGTITLTSGSKNFTTTGAALQSAAKALPGDTIIRNGYFLVIESITSETAGTLVEACPAAAARSAGGVGYRSSIE